MGPTQRRGGGLAGYVNGSVDPILRHQRAQVWNHPAGSCTGGGAHQKHFKHTPGSQQRRLKPSVSQRDSTLYSILLTSRVGAFGASRLEDSLHGVAPPYRRSDEASGASRRRPMYPWTWRTCVMMTTCDIMTFPGSNAQFP
ncbi:hypothetical protein FKM82_012489 [Ascaphus truei]